MTPRRRRAVLGAVVAALALTAVSAAWIAGRALEQLDEIRSRSEPSSEARDAAWAPPDALTCDLDPPRDAMDVWTRQLAQADDERLPMPPVELVAWLRSHAAEVDALAARVRATGPIALPDTGTNNVSNRGLTKPILAAARAARLLVASAGVAAVEGRHEVAEERLEAAWTLQVSLLRLRWMGGVGNHFLGALRVVRSHDPGAWLERLDAVEQRDESAERFAADARRTVRDVEWIAEHSVPAWLPTRFRPWAVRVAAIPQACTQGPGALAHLDARDVLVTQDPCADPMGLVEPSWTRDLALPQWLPGARRARMDDLLARASRRMADLSLTREVLAVRAGVVGVETCGPRVRVTRGSDGRLTAVVDTPPDDLGVDPMWLEGATSFTFTAPGVSPVMASAPGR